MGKNQMKRNTSNESLLLISLPSITNSDICSKIGFNEQYENQQHSNNQPKKDGPAGFADQILINLLARGWVDMQNLTSAFCQRQ